MEYPGSILTRPIRLAILGAFIAAFFIISPLVLLYANGWRFDFHEGIFRKTGGMSIDILPKNATVQLNGLKLKGKMPYRLKNITPDTYVLSLSAPGYIEWQKEVEVKDQQTVYIKDIEMIKKEEAVLIKKGEIKNLSLSPNGRYLAYAENINGSSTLFLRDNSNGNETRIKNYNVDFLGIFWDKQNGYFAVSNTNPPFSFLDVFGAENGSIKTSLIKPGALINKLQWKDGTPRELLYSVGSTLYSYLPDSGQTLTLTKKITSDWFMSGNELWTFGAGTTTPEINLIKDFLGFSSVKTTISGGTSSIKNWSINLARGDSALLRLNSVLKLYNGRSLFDLAGKKYFISPFNSWWVIWTEDELWTYSEGQEPQLFSRSGNKLVDVIPIDANNSLALVWQNKVTALFPYYYITHDLIGEPVQILIANPKDRILYYSNSKGLWQMAY